MIVEIHHSGWKPSICSRQLYREMCTIIYEYTKIINQKELTKSTAENYYGLRQWAHIPYWICTNRFIDWGRFFPNCSVVWTCSQVGFFLAFGGSISVQVFRFSDCGEMYIESFQPEWCISSMIYSRDTPFWSETLDIVSSCLHLQIWWRVFSM